MDPVAASAIAVFLALLLGVAAIDKLGDPGRFAGVLASYALLPERWVPAAARLVPVGEAALAVAWLLPWRWPWLGMVTATLLLGYGAGMAINLLRGRRDIHCGCGVHAGDRLSWHLVSRNGVLAALAVATTLPLTPRTIGISDAIVTLAAATTLGLLYLSAGQLLSNAQRLDAWRRDHEVG
jgi:hypothetical protein